MVILTQKYKIQIQTHKRIYLIITQFKWIHFNYYIDIILYFHEIQLWITRSLNSVTHSLSSSFIIRWQKNKRMGQSNENELTKIDLIFFVEIFSYIFHHSNVLRSFVSGNFRCKVSLAPFFVVVFMRLVKHRLNNFDNFE